MEHSPSRRASFFQAATSERERGTLSREAAMRQLHFPPLLASKLCEEAVLKGHMGCVNRLAWNSDGSRIVSGSDDRKVMIWKYPEAHAPPLALHTQHDANIFGVHFLPCTGDRMVVSGSMDHTVNLHRLDSLKAEARADWAPRGRGAGEVDPRTTVYACHRGRVKDVEVEPMNPHNFWSVSEDGTIRQFDVRSSERQNEFESRNVLIGVRDKNTKEEVELKGLDINKVRPDYMAVACGDPYVRVYDRRMLSQGAAGDVCPIPVLAVAPPHLSIRPSPRSHTTYVNFGNTGDKIVASYHGDHAYAFDVTSEGTACCSYVVPGACKMPRKQQWRDQGSASRNGYHGSKATLIPPHPFAIPSLTGQALQQAEHAWECEQAGQRTKAIDCCSQALHLAPAVSELYAQRARLYLLRGLVGDAAFALRDADQAIALNSMCLEAHLARLRALKGLGQLQTAKCLLALVLERPDAEDSGLFDDFKTDLNNALREQSKKETVRRKRARMQHSSLNDHDSPTRAPSTVTERGADMDTDELPPLPCLAEEHDGREGGHPRNVPAGGSDDEDDGSEGLLEDRGQGDRGTRGDDEEPQEEKCMKHYRNGSSYWDSGEPSVSGYGQEPAGIWWSLSGGRRMLTRYIGQCNVQTDIKESVFLGQNDDLVACGSDDGKVFIFNTATGKPVQVLNADNDVANCVQCHPTVPVLATSGIEKVVRLWSPIKDPNEPDDIEEAVNQNQERMKEGPQSMYGPLNEHTFQLLLDNYELVQLLAGRRDRRGNASDDEEDEEEEEGGAGSCRLV